MPECSEAQSTHGTLKNQISVCDILRVIMQCAESVGGPSTILYLPDKSSNTGKSCVLRHLHRSCEFITADRQTGSHPHDPAKCGDYFGMHMT